MGESEEASKVTESECAPSKAAVFCASSGMAVVG